MRNPSSRIKSSLIVTFALVICTVLGLANPATVNAKAKVKNIKKTTTITLTKEEQKIDLRKALGKFKKYVTTDESFVKITKKPYDQELYYQKPGVYYVQLAGVKVNKNFKLKAKKGNKKLTLTVKIKNKIKKDTTDFDNYDNDDSLYSPARLEEDEWFVKCIDSLKAIIANENTIADYLWKNKHRVFNNNVPFETRQILCINHWLAKRMKYYWKDNKPCHEGTYATFEHLYKGTWRSVCWRGAEAEYKIYKYLGFETKLICKRGLNHEWCVVKLINPDGGEVAYGVETMASFGCTYWWWIMNHNEIFDRRGKDFYAFMPEADTGRLEVTIGTRKINLTATDDFLKDPYYVHHALRNPANQTPTTTATPTATATPTSEPEATIDIDEIYYDEDEEEAA